MTFVNVFDDGSKASKLLQDDLKNRNLHLNIVKVDPTDTLSEWFTKINGDNKTYLHFTYEDYIKNNEKLRKEVDKVEHLGFRNLIVREYEGLDQKTMEYRYSILEPKPVQRKFHVGKGDDVYQVDESTATDLIEIKGKYSGQSVIEPIDPPKMGIPAEFGIDPDTEMKEAYPDMDSIIESEPLKPDKNEAPYYRSYDFTDEKFKFKSEEFKNKRRRKVS